MDLTYFYLFSSAYGTPLSQSSLTGTNSCIKEQYHIAIVLLSRSLYWKIKAVPNRLLNSVISQKGIKNYILAGLHIKEWILIAISSEW